MLRQSWIDLACVMAAIAVMPPAMWLAEKAASRWKWGREGDDKLR